MCDGILTLLHLILILDLPLIYNLPMPYVTGNHESSEYKINIYLVT